MPTCLILPASADVMQHGLVCRASCDSSPKSKILLNRVPVLALPEGGPCMPQQCTGFMKRIPIPAVGRHMLEQMVALAEARRVLSLIWLSKILIGPSIWIFLRTHQQQLGT